MIASTLHHHEARSDVAKQGIIRDATERSLVITSKYNYRESRVGCYDRRLAPEHEKVFLSMVEGYEFTRQKNINTDLDVYMLQTSNYENICSRACNIGWW